MKFVPKRRFEEPEINLIPMIDVLLVIIIFLMLTTTYAKFSGLEINLPQADGSPSATQNKEIDVVVTAVGQILVDKQALPGKGIAEIQAALQKAAKGQSEPLIVINADAKASHQSVVDVMQAAQAAGYPRISFATQTPR